MATAEAGLRERKKQRTRETIARVALELFTRQGFRTTTIRQIADAADVAPRTVSGYFPVKEELLFFGHEPIFASLERRLREREPGESASDALGVWLRGFLASEAIADLERTRCVRDLVETEPSLRTYERGLQERVERIVAAAVAVDLDVPADDLLPHMVGAATMAVLDALGETLKDSPPAEVGERGAALIDQAVAFLGAGVRALAARSAS